LARRSADKPLHAPAAVSVEERERVDRELYYKLCLVRAFDERVSVLHRQNKVVGGVYSGVGQEAVEVGACQPLREGDLVFPLHRDMGVFLLRGVDPRRLMAQILGRRDGLSGGRDSFLHTGDVHHGVIGATSMLGATLPVATGAALGFRNQGKDNVAVAFFGEGSTSRGDFHESLNFAGIHQLPVIYVCENNQYAFTTPLRLQMAVETVSERADAYGIKRARTNGNDLNRVREEMEKAINRARAGGGPTLIECVTYRIHGHSEHDPARYREAIEVVEWGARDPIELWELYLEKRGFEMDKLKEETLARAKAVVDDAVEFAENSPWPEAEAARTAIFIGPGEGGTEPPAAPDGTPGAWEPDSLLDVRPEGDEVEVNYLTAIRNTLAFEMERDPRVFCLGEDIGIGGGAFGVTEGLLDRFGPDRVVDTPIAESLIMGGSVGASLVGLVPVAEMQFGDFISCGFDGLVNTAATMSYRHAGQVGAPIVVRCPSGARIRGGLFHSQNVEAFFLATPGIKIVAPANAGDASGLLRSAIHDPNPVLFLEYKYLYRREKARLSGGVAAAVPIGLAAVRRPGSQLTLVTYGPTTPLCLEAATRLESEGFDPEVIDLRTVKPLDMETILVSLRKTGRLVIVHEDRAFSGLGAEIAARVCEASFELLDAPIKRVATADTHYAYSPPLEDSILPSVESILEACREVLRY
jgi:2-oxoisovalerate dehydrogenase E1 component